MAKFVIEVDCGSHDYEGNASHPIEYESAEKLLSDLKEFCAAEIAAAEKNREEWAEWDRLETECPGNGLQQPKIRQDMYFRDCIALGLNCLQPWGDGPFRPPAIYTLDEWFEVRALKPLMSEECGFNQGDDDGEASVPQCLPC